MLLGLQPARKPGEFPRRTDHPMARRHNRNRITPIRCAHRPHRRRIADLRGKTDAAVIEALLNISDSRFQPGLIEQAQKVGKLPKDFRIDPRFADNTPERLQAIAARHPNLFPEYPLGCDFTAIERDLLRALNWLKSKFKLTEILELGKAALDAPQASLYPEHLERMQLANPEGLKEDLFQRLLLTGLKATAQ